MKNRIHILQFGNANSVQYKGEVMINKRIEIETNKFANKILCINALNRKITDYNLFRQTKIPLFDKKSEVMELEFELNPKKETDKKLEQAVKVEQAVETEQKIVKKPHRKPFTPYGLNGYLVDKQGNIRLHLDRKVNAQTIVLTPDMFTALSDMVRKTQEQQHG